MSRRRRGIALVVLYLGLSFFGFVPFAAPGVASVEV
jgi:hypothetical protein